MKLDEAKGIAVEIVGMLEGACEEIEIAGSIRRRAEEVGDIEIVARPRWGENLFGEADPGAVTRLNELLVETMGGWRTPGRPPIRRGDLWGRRQKKLIVVESGIKVDLFIVLPPAQWGKTLALRTGPAGYSRWLVTGRQKGGATPSVYTHKQGALWYKGKLVETPTEESFFERLGVAWVRPEERRAPARWAV